MLVFLSSCLLIPEVKKKKKKKSCKPAIHLHHCWSQLRHHYMISIVQIGCIWHHCMSFVEFCYGIIVCHLLWRSEGTDSTRKTRFRNYPKQKYTQNGTQWWVKGHSALYCLCISCQHIMTYTYGNQDWIFPWIRMSDQNGAVNSVKKSGQSSDVSFVFPVIENIFI